MDKAYVEKVRQELMQQYTMAPPMPKVAPAKTQAELEREELNKLIADYSPLWSKRYMGYYIDTYNYYKRNYSHLLAMTTVRSQLQADKRYRVAEDEAAALVAQYKDYVPTNKDIEELLFHDAVVVPLNKMSPSVYLSSCCASVNSDSWRDVCLYLLNEDRREGNRILWGFKPPEPKMVEYFPESLDIEDKDVGTLRLRWDYESPEGYRPTNEDEDY